MPDLQTRMRLDCLRRTALPTGAILPVIIASVLLCLVLPIHMARDIKDPPHCRKEARVLTVTPISGKKWRDACR